MKYFARINLFGLTRSTRCGILIMEEKEEVCNVTKLGIALRKIRLDRQELLKDMATKLKVSSAFLSAVETGKKRPPANFIDRICSLYELNDEEKSDLLLAADMSLDEIKINLSEASLAQRQVAVSFAKALDGLTDDEIGKIMRVFNERHKK